MNDFHEPHFGASGRDPLERIIDAFVDQSVPEGPEEGVKLRLVAAMTMGQLERAAKPATRLAPAVGKRLAWGGSVARQVFGLAAAIAVVVATALFTLWRKPSDGNVPVRNGDEVIASTPRSEVDDAELQRVLEWLRDESGQIPDERTLSAMFAVVFRGKGVGPESDRWRRAQERLTYALERPEVIGMGVGILGTLPWATYARF